jgi:redox-sensitive bicupin YhaK (pirin superfamily)
MITLRRGDERGRADHGWLLSYHTFSFADYYDPRHMGFRALRVINQDRVAPGHGFPTHPHREMEILSYVLEGQLEHADTIGSGSTIGPGEAQVISAGTGMAHSEYNPSPAEPVHFLQIWIVPAADQRGQAPVYAQQAFAEPARRNQLRLVASGDGRDGSLRLRQDAGIYVTLLDGGQHVAHPLPAGRHAWVHVARGRVTLNGQALGPGDGAALSDEPEVRLQGDDAANGAADVVLFDLP